jgi:hypothetical protein
MSLRYTDFWEQMASAAVVRSEPAAIKVANELPCRVVGAPCGVVEMEMPLTPASVMMDDEQGGFS